jgi:DeoR/GlpR family transcriptional regulator of sugar metabolism
LTIVTNSLPIAFGLLHYKEEGHFDGRVVLLGGETRSASMSVSGFFAEDMLSKISFNKAFFPAAVLLRIVLAHICMSI